MEICKETRFHEAGHAIGAVISRIGLSSPRSRRTMRSTVSKAAMPDRTPNWVSRSLRSGTLPIITDS